MKINSKNILHTILILSIILFIGSSCDGNDDDQTTPIIPADGFTISNTFYGTENTYIAIDQSDRDNNGKSDYYTFFFTNGRITDVYGDIGLGYAHAFSTATTQLVKLQVFESANANLSTGILQAGNTYVASSILTTSINGFGVTNSGYSKDSFIAYNLQPGSNIFNDQTTLDFTQILEVAGVWHYVGTVGPSITINAINIDNNTPTNSTINVDYTFLDTNGDTISGHYEGTLGIILD